MLEHEAVLKRPEHLTRAGLSSGDIDILLDQAAAVVEAVRLRFLWRPMLRNPKDEMVLETAVNGGVDLLITINLRDLEAGATRFGIPAMRPGGALALLRKDRA